ncbi:MAG: dihydropteroate synthase [Pirellulales bacterium]
MSQQQCTGGLAKRSQSWRLRTRVIEFDRQSAVMGIVNVTPDSFSDGGQFFSPTAAIDHGLRLVDEGADLLDVGGESTRPYSAPVDADEERRRVVGVVATLAERSGVPVSIDTSKAVVAAAALAAGAEIINDVTALTGDEAMLPLAVDTACGICAMHMQGTPQTMQDNPHYVDVVAEVASYLALRRDALTAAGVDLARIALDPGIGFGKTHAHNIALVRHCGKLHELSCPLLVGHSRKGFIGKLIGDKDAERTAGTLGVSLALARIGVQVLRVHDVAATRQALATFVASGGLDRTEP